MKGVKLRKGHESKHGRHLTDAPLVATTRGLCLVQNKMTSCSEESEHPGKSLIAQAFPKMSPGNLGVFDNFLFAQGKRQ